MNKKICVVLPTLNEEKNILNIFNYIKKTKVKLDILFIDDDSTDSSRKIIKELKKKNSNIFYIFRKKRGLGSAHKDGLKWCYKYKYKKIITMDCDGTHDPRYFKKMINYSNTFDLVITSRFLKKGSISDWPWTRKFITVLRHYLLKLFLKINYDASGAYRCISTKNIKLSHFLLAKSNNYSFFWESLYYLNKKKILIKEIPVKLFFRKLGTSKMRLKDIIHSIYYLIKITFNKNNQN